MVNRKSKKSKKITVQMQKKLLLIFLLIVAALIILSIFLIKIHLSKGEDYSKAVYDNFDYDSRVIPARRGDITDRNGTVLAYSTKVYNLIIDTKVLLSNEDCIETTIKAVVKNFDVNEEELRAFIEENRVKKENGGTASSYKRLLTTLPEDKVTPFIEEINKDKSGIKGIWFEEEYLRSYPYGSLACDLIGFASEANGGELGIESSYEKYLSGTDGREYGYINNSAYETTVIDQINGGKVVSTIDIYTQTVIEEELSIFQEAYGFETATVLVMDPNSGEILGLCDAPFFDLNHPRDMESVFSKEDLEGLTEEERVEKMYRLWSNYAVSSIYEPGSVFKPFTIAAALEEDVANSEDIYECDGEETYDASKISCNGGEGHGELTLGESLCWSCNDALMQIAMDEGKLMFSKYVHAFKFGEKTGIDLPGEAKGLVIDYEGMMDVDLATNAFGQNINVSMVQTAAAFSSLINGGNYYAPHAVKEIQNSMGETVKEIEPVLVSKTVSEETSDILCSYLRGVVDYGTGYLLRREGYSIGGKTGTAEKQPRDKENYIVSFMSFAPAEEAKVLVYVVIDSPNCEFYDASTAAQIVAANIMDKLMPYYGVPQDDADYEVPYVHLSTEADKKNGELKISSDGIIELTGEKFMIRRDEMPEEEENLEGESPETEIPEGETPETEIPEGEAPEGEIPEGEAPEGEIPEEVIPPAEE